MLLHPSRPNPASSCRPPGSHGSVKASASLRTLDAIHLATASLFGTTLTRIVCYDERMSRAAEAGNRTVAAPA